MQTEGRVETRGSVAYVSQQAWIQNHTLRGNVLFGEEYDPEWYRTVIDASCLRADLQA